MKVKLAEIVDAMPAMAVFARKELPAKAAYRVAKLVRKMTDEHRDFQAARTEAFKKYGEKTMLKDERGQEQEGYKLKPENMEACDQELRALLDEEVDLEGCTMIAFADIEKLELAPAVLADLEPFIEAPKG